MGNAISFAVNSFIWHQFKK